MIVLEIITLLIAVLGVLSLAFLIFINSYPHY